MSPTRENLKLLLLSAIVITATFTTLVVIIGEKDVQKRLAASGSWRRFGIQQDLPILADGDVGCSDTTCTANHTYIGPQAISLAASINASTRIQAEPQGAPGGKVCVNASSEGEVIGFGYRFYDSPPIFFYKDGVVIARANEIEEKDLRERFPTRPVFNDLAAGDIISTWKDTWKAYLDDGNGSYSVETNKIVCITDTTDLPPAREDQKQYCVSHPKPGRGTTQVGQRIAYNPDDYETVCTPTPQKHVKDYVAVQHKTITKGDRLFATCFIDPTLQAGKARLELQRTVEPFFVFGNMFYPSNIDALRHSDGSSKIIMTSSSFIEINPAGALEENCNAIGSPGIGTPLPDQTPQPSITVSPTPLGGTSIPTPTLTFTPAPSPVDGDSSGEDIFQTDGT